MKLIFVIILSVLVSAFRQDEPIVNVIEFNLLSGAKWVGYLTYLDYGSNKIVSIPVELSVNQSANDTNIFVFKYEFTNEPDANGYDTVKINLDGKFLNNEEIIFKSVLDGDTLKIITEEFGKDDERDAKFRHTYLINNRSFSVKKEIKFLDEEEFIRRNEYKFAR